MKMRYVFLRMIALVSIIIFLGSIPSYAEGVRGGLLTILLKWVQCLI